MIDLSRLPSHGLAVAGWLRQTKATRRVPIVFVGGDAARAKKLLPDATYTEWSRIRSALRRAIAHPPGKPVVPGTMDAYSGTPLPKKLGVEGRTVALIGAPDGFARTIGVRSQRKGDVVILFSRSMADLRRRFAAAAHAAGARLWLAWPKKTSGLACDLGELEVRAFGLARRWVDFKICAIDATWSGLAFARRRE